MEFVNFEVAKKLKEKGFDWETSNVYEKNILACRYEDYPKPTISQVLKWLRKEKGIICLPHIEPIEEKWFFYVVKLPQASDFPEYLSSVIYNTYEEAAMAGIEWVLDNILL